MKFTFVSLAMLGSLCIGCNNGGNADVETGDTAAAVVEQPAATGSATGYDTVPMYDAQGEIVGDTIIPKQ